MFAFSGRCLRKEKKKRKWFELEALFISFSRYLGFLSPLPWVGVRDSTGKLGLFRG